jgi:RimJ/RimL family protein N-acetyltransferase
LVVSKQYWGQGIAVDAQETILTFLFEELGLRLVRLYTNSGNPAAIGIAQKTGFSISVRTRQSVWRAGALHDNIVMELLREDFYARHPELTDNLPPL